MWVIYDNDGWPLAVCDNARRIMNLKRTWRWCTCIVCWASMLCSSQSLLTLFEEFLISWSPFNILNHISSGRLERSIATNVKGQSRTMVARKKGDLWLCSTLSHIDWIKSGNKRFRSHFRFWYQFETNMTGDSDVIRTGNAKSMQFSVFGLKLIADWNESGKN